MTFKIKNHNAIYLHVPKCGGSSLFQTLKNDNWVEGKLQNTHPTISEILKLGIDLDHYEIIAQIRNPYYRFYSHYHFIVEDAENRINGIREFKKNMDLEYYKKYKDFLIQIGFKGFVKLLEYKKNRDIFLNKFNHKDKGAFTTLNDFLKGAKKVKIFKLEDGNLLNYLKTKYKIIPTKIFYEKKSNYRTIDYDQYLADIVYNYFELDFLNFEYAKNSWKIHSNLNE